jgi:predicted Zn-dependent protease
MSARLILACCAALLIGGCGYGDETVTDQERRIGAEQHPQLLAQFGGSYSGEEADYLERLGGKIAAAAGLTDRCTFTLVNTDVVNAFAVPGCYIYVTRGLMGIVNSEAELASVLAHEVGHISGNHSERQQRRSLFRGLGVAAISAVTGSERLSQLAGAAASLFTLRYSRKHEYEADDLGVSYLKQAGYDPYAAVDMLAALGRHQQFLTASRGRDEAKSIPEWALTHPLTEHRVERSRAAAEATGLAPDELADNGPTYLQELDGLLYGDDPAQGFVTGRRFAHPVMRVGFEAPPGFTLSNTPQAVLIEGPDGMQGEFAGGRMPSGGLPAYAQATLAALLRNASVEVGTATPATINTVPTLLLPGVVRTREGPVAFSLAAYQGQNGDAFHLIIVSKPNAAPADAITTLFRSFRLLSTAEAASLRPRRIRTVRIGAGDTLRSAARQMATDQPVEHFLMLNGRSERAPLRPGELVKIVAESTR